MLVDISCSLFVLLRQWLLASASGQDNILESVFWARQRGDTGADVLVDCLD